MDTEGDVQQNMDESELSKLRSRVEYLEYKCREIEKALRAMSRKRRVFRNPLIDNRASRMIGL